MRAYYDTYYQDLKATLKLSYPIIIGQIGVTLMGFIDTVMVGRFSTTALAASAVANAIFFILTVLGLGTVSIMTPLVASSHSKDDKEACGAILSAGVRVAIFTGIIFIGIAYLLVEFFYIFDQPKEVVPLATEYLIIITFSAVPMLLFRAFKHFAEGLSETKPAMYVTYASVVINFFLNWILIYGKLGFPALGLAGAGYATLLTRTIMAVGLSVYVFKHARFQPFLTKFSWWKNAKTQINEILRKGLPAGFQMFFEVSAFAGTAVMMGWLGKIPQAAHQIAINLASITYMAATGFSIAGSIRVGNAYGAKNPKQIFRAGTTALVLGFVFMFICCLAFIIFNYPLVRLYNGNPEVIHIATSLVIIAGFFQLSDGVQVVSLGALRGIGDVNIPTIITLFAYWIVAVPVGYLLCFFFEWGAQGMWIGLLLGLTFSAILLTLRFYWLVYANRKQEQVGV
ncbi:hypothetical protein BKI52_28665 [marine bacterium AO1-C]|nr:hypothetical protein BKI52_28665 [marine bacterium AO1-C]